MNLQKFNIPGGYPLETDTLVEIQNAYKLFNALGQIAGDKAIIAGCEEDGESVGDGVVYLKDVKGGDAKGEVFEFRGGTKQPTVVIKEDIYGKIFEDGEEHEVLYKRYISFGSGEGAMDWNDFKRYRLIEEVSELKADIGAKLSDLNTKLADKYYTQDQTDAFFEGERYGKKQVNWDRVTEKPSSYPPASHNHDSLYYRKNSIRSYGHLTFDVYNSVGKNHHLWVNYYESGKVACAFEVEDTYEEITWIKIRFASVKIIN